MDQPNPENELYEEGAELDAMSLVYAIAAAPEVEPGTQGAAFAALSDGLLRSPDGGQTWEDALASLELSEPLPVTCAVVTPNGHVFAGTSGGVFRSKDGGETWQARLLPSPPPTVSALAVSPRYLDDETVFAGTMEDGVFISRDGGQSWVAWNFGFLDLNVLCLAVSPNFAEDETLFAGTETGIFRSTNGGRAWREVELPFGFAAVVSLAVSPNFAGDETLFAGTEEQGLWVSRDAGDTWQQLGAFDFPINSILLQDGELLLLTSAGLLTSADGGATWQERTPALDEDQEISAILAPQGFGSGARVLAGFIGGEIKILTLR